jgi:hypothetical protein
MLELALAPTAGTSVAQARDHNHGIHEVTGSIPVSSTNSSDNLAGQQLGEEADSSISCLFSVGTL